MCVKYYAFLCIQLFHFILCSQGIFIFYAYNSFFNAYKFVYFSIFNKFEHPRPYNRITIFYVSVGGLGTEVKEWWEKILNSSADNTPEYFVPVRRSVDYVNKSDFFSWKFQYISVKNHGFTERQLNSNYKNKNRSAVLLSLSKKLFM